MAASMEQVWFRGAQGNRLAASAIGDGDAPIVLLLPAVGQSRHVWSGAAIALAAAGRRAICVDLRGHCDSEPAPGGDYDLSGYAADLAAVLAQLPSRATVVGVGPSGLAALVAAGEGGADLMSALVLVGVTAWVDPETAARIRVALERRAEAFADETAVLDAIARVHPFEPAPSATRQLIGAYERGEDALWRWRGDARTFAGFDLAAQSARIEAAAAKLRLPALLIRGTLNESVSRAATDRLQAMIAGAEAVEIDGGGHYVVTDHEDAFNARLLEFLERRLPLQARSYQSGADPRLLRDAMGCFGTGVTVVTTLDAEGAPIGFTANSFTSVSLDPPLVLFCIARKSANLQSFVDARSFAINILHIGQQPTSDRFARPGDARFEGIEWQVREGGGAPILTGSRASFDCTTHAIHDGGDHLIVVGRVERADFEPHRDPLLYLQGKYRRVHFA
ncbi:alpha/beta fold hydrolase [Sphingomonas immobilis]|uniref:Alpha/beta fold hydrolase n=1 Tax=Sphingomonas immobilis TaxID=3063997 RepID=A0ABT8ZX51_9SPHN|nr:alpha/beta fold hydrolase [Sphingomonas sp. CA1-15]MDO7842140.1 alpha/beta fold hydrolase [Sphingomonas sp. CA1-15]